MDRWSLRQLPLQDFNSRIPSVPVLRRSITDHTFLSDGALGSTYYWFCNVCVWQNVWRPERLGVRSAIIFHKCQLPCSIIISLIQTNQIASCVSFLGHWSQCVWPDQTVALSFGNKLLNCSLTSCFTNVLCPVHFDFHILVGIFMYQGQKMSNSLTSVAALQASDQGSSAKEIVWPLQTDFFPSTEAIASHAFLEWLVDTVARLNFPSSASETI
jgi:hypothetical protein